MDSYYSQQTISWEKYISSAVNDMVSAGIDFISDGQTRDPFVQIFTRKLAGCRIRDRTEIIGTIGHTESITVEDQRFVRNIIPKEKKLLGVLTGPYTLSQSCVDLFYHDEKQVAFDFAKALRKEAELLQSFVDLISIDEPFFSNFLPDYGNELLSLITKNLSCPTRLHVCGDVTSIIAHLLEMPVDILSHEFKASPHLLDSFNNYTVSKQICLGSVRSDDSRVESVEEITTHFEKAQNVFDDNIIQLAPDCGQRMLPQDVAYKKLQNLVKAGEVINGR
jgi:5-methyltetrahydropteroyltriglutamate--homocysteine methyltransferase